MNVAERLQSLLPSFITKRSLHSRSTFPNTTSLDAIRNYLKTVKATGQMVVNYSQGGINSIFFEERNDVNGADRIEVR